MCRQDQFLRAMLIVLCSIGVTDRAAAQQTREEQIALEQTEKSRNLHPYEPTTLERRIETIQKSLLNPPPVYPFIGSVMRGGLLAVGPGFRGRYAETGRFNMHGAWSLKNYKLADASLTLPTFADRRVGIGLRANWIDAPSVAFYGIGDGSRVSDKTTFLYRTTTVGASARIQAAPVLAVGGGVDDLRIESGSGKGGTPIERLFTPGNTAGLGSAPDYTRSQLFLEVDWRQSPGYTRSGGLYRVEWNNYDQRTGSLHDFRRIDAEVDQFIPLLRENWVIALRALASFTDTDGANTVPYFLLPDLGGGRELRGYPSWRFRDRQKLLLTGEYRWMAGQFVDMALFLDAGKVAARRSDLDLSSLRTTYGMGVRFHTPIATVMRIEVVHTHEGAGLVFAFSPVF